VSFLYTRNKFGWDIRKHTQFSGAAMLVSVFGKFKRKYLIHRSNILYHVHGGNLCTAAMDVMLKHVKSRKLIFLCHDSFRCYFLLDVRVGLLCRISVCLTCLTSWQRIVIKLTLLWQVPILTHFCLVKAWQTAGPQFTLVSFGFYGSHDVKVLSLVCTAQRLHLTNRNGHLKKTAKLVFRLGRGTFLFTYSPHYCVSDLFKNYCFFKQECNSQFHYEAHHKKRHNCGKMNL
jgi:hypothetical protein